MTKKMVWFSSIQIQNAVNSIMFESIEIEGHSNIHVDNTNEIDWKTCIWMHHLKLVQSELLIFVNW